MRQPRTDFGDQRVSRREFGLLFQKRNAHDGRSLDLPAVGLIKAGEDLHQRGLAAAVGADEPDAFATAHVKGDVPEDRIAIELPDERSSRKLNHCR
jgi:hypothetical protein